jgi:hypothetical protein
MILTPCPQKGQHRASGGKVAQTRPPVKGFCGKVVAKGGFCWDHLSKRGWKHKSEIRIPKLETNTKFKVQRLKTVPGLPVLDVTRFAPFGFVSDFGFGISDLGDRRLVAQFRRAQ